MFFSNTRQSSSSEQTLGVLRIQTWYRGVTPHRVRAQSHKAARTSEAPHQLTVSQAPMTACLSSIDLLELLAELREKASGWGAHSGVQKGPECRSFCQDLVGIPSPEAHVFWYRLTCSPTPSSSKEGLKVPNLWPLSPSGDSLPSPSHFISINLGLRWRQRTHLSLGKSPGSWGQTRCVSYSTTPFCVKFRRISLSVSAQNPAETLIGSALMGHFAKSWNLFYVEPPCPWTWFVSPCV